VTTRRYSVCDEVQRHLPGYVDGSLSRARRRLVGLHLRRCATCQAAYSTERGLAAGLRVLAAPVEEPPEGLLEELLSQAANPGVKARAAVPARGAVSGARPALSVALLVAGAAAGTSLGWASWRGVRRLRGR
jgi:predicted anti-sigma-YlaC factor YlaD